MRKFVVAVAVAALAVPALADLLADAPAFQVSPKPIGPATRNVLVYDNTLGSIFSSSVNPPAALDDGSFTPGPGAGGNTTVIGANIGFVVVGTGNASFDLAVSFFDTLTPNAEPVNSGFLGGFIVGFTNIPPGGYETGMLDLTGLGGIYFPDDDWAVEYRFLVPGTQTLSNRGTALFAGGPVAVGSSQDVYWRDVDGNGLYRDPDEARFFGGPPNEANFYLQLEVIPEPAAFALLAVGLLLRRR